MTYGSLWERLVRGVRWSWIDPRYRASLPPDLDSAVMGLDSRDRFHAKQGRSTARVVFQSAEAPRGPVPRTTGYAASASATEATPSLQRGAGLAVYLKRHVRLPWPSGMAALLDPGGRHSPGAAEWAHLERARALGIPVPDVVATGERIGPWASLQSYLIVAELTGCEELNVALVQLVERLGPEEFAALKRRLIAEMARITATLHEARIFHKDLYLCHFFLDCTRLERDPADVRLVLIDLHRLAEHRLLPDRWRWKDLGQLLFSTVGVPGIDERDILRFWARYRRRVRMRWPAWQARMSRHKADRYLRHNRS